MVFRAIVRTMEAITMHCPPKKTLNLTAGMDKANRVDVITVAFNNSELIRLQHRFLQKNLKDNYHQIIVDNSTNAIVREELYAFCLENGLTYVGLPKNLLNYVGPSYSHANALNYTYRKIIRQRHPFAFGQIDHDLFPIAPFSVVEKLSNQPFYGPLRHRGKCWYLSGIMSFFRYDYVYDKKVDFMPVTPDKIYLDTGGGNWYPIYSKLNLEQLHFPNECIEPLRMGGDRHGDSLEYFDDKHWLHTINGSCWKKIEKEEEKNRLVRNYLNSFLEK